MNFKEAFSIIETNERALSPILRERRKIEEFKQQLMDPSQDDGRKTPKAFI